MRFVLDIEEEGSLAKAVKNDFPTAASLRPLGLQRHLLSLRSLLRFCLLPKLQEIEKEEKRTAAAAERNEQVVFFLFALLVALLLNLLLKH